MARNDHELMECYLPKMKWQRHLDHKSLSPIGAANVMQLVKDTYVQGRWKDAIPLYSPPEYRPDVLYRTDIEMMSSAWPRWPLRTYVALKLPGERWEFLGFITFRPDPELTNLNTVLSAAMLFPPEHLIRDYSIVMSDFGNYLGELRGMDGVPLVSAPVVDVERGAPVGACMEGCVSMASWLMARFGARVWGLADIAAVLNDFADKGRGTYELFKAGPDRAREFFRSPRVGLNAFHHSFRVAGYGKTPASVALSDVVLGLRSYLRNGFPIICSAPPGYLPRGWPRHVFLLVGYERKRVDPRDQGFILHDSNPPPGKPMLFGKVGARDLIGCPGKTKKGGAPNKLDCVVPVPPNIRAALVPHTEGTGGAMESGIMSRFRSIQSSRTKASTAGDRAGNHGPLENLGAPGDVVLCHRRELFRRYLSQNLTDAVGRSEEWGGIVQDEAAPEFLWVQPFLPRERDSVSGIWIWDATKDVTGETFPLGQCSLKRFWLSCLDGRRIEAEVDGAPKRKKLKVLPPERLEVALISSFSREQLPRVAQEMAQHGFGALDLYVFNEADARLYLDKEPEERLEAALRRADARAVVRRMAWDLSRAKAEGVQIVGLTTYLPSIVSPDEKLCKLGQGSLLKIVEIAKHLRSAGHPVRHVELVAGSRVRVRSNDDGSRAWAEVDVDGRLEQLFATLRKAARKASDLGFDPPLRLVVELEPGVVNLVRDGESLDGVFQEITRGRSRDLTKCSAGVNIDVSHMRLAKVEPNFFQSRDRMGFVHHAHFDDMAPFGHASDLRVGSLSADEEYIPWLELLLDMQYHHEVRRVGNGYTGYISVEMEAPRDRSQAYSSGIALQMLIEKAVWRRRGFEEGPPLGPWIFEREAERKGAQ